MKDPKKIELSPPWDGPVATAAGMSENPLWDFEQIEVPHLWAKYAVDGKGVNAFVIDSGIVPHHLFSHKPFVALSFLDDTTDPHDANGHGTWCCGKIGAKGVGIAPGCTLHSLRTLDDQGNGYTYYTTDALRWINRHPDPHIVNMSLGSTYNSVQQAKACKDLWDRGCLVIAAAGNEDTNDLSYPAAYDGVVAVAATDSLKKRAWFSNYGDHIVVSAPGVSCYSTYLNSQFRKLQGTSMASPTVAGLLALGYSWLLKNKPGWPRTEMRDHLIDCLKRTAIDLGQAGKDDFHGYGGINGPGFMAAVTS